MKQGIVFGTGYVGSAWMQQWPDANASLIATTTRKERVSELQRLTPRVEIVRGNERERIEELFAEADFAIVSVAPNDRSKYQETYLESAGSIAGALKKRSRPFYLLYTSSTSVYGNHHGATVNEFSPLLANTANGKILIEAENAYAQAASPCVHVCILRLGGIYGPGRDISRFARHFSAKTVTGRDAPTNYSSLPLITEGINWCLANRLTGTFNLVDNSHPTKGELYGGLLQQQNLPAPVWEKPHTGGALVSIDMFLETGFRFDSAN